MTDYSAAFREATDPATSQARLGELANEVPEVRAAIAEHPSAYDALLTWLSQLQDPAVDAALLRRAGGTVPATPPPAAPALDVYATMQSPAAAVAVATPSAAQVTAPATPAAASGRWQEPTRSLSLKWGSYQPRYLIAVALVVLPLVLSPLLPLLAYRTNYSVYNALIIVAALLPAIGWVAALVIIPSTGVRRGIAVPLVLLGAYGGAMSIGIGGLGLVFAMLAWLILRGRPGLSYLVLIATPGALVITAIGMDYRFYDVRFIFSLLALLLLVGLAWLARAIATKRRPVSFVKAPPVDREAVEHAARVAHVKQWEAAYAEAHGGHLPPAGFVPPMAAMPTGETGKTNTLAILALVFGFGGGLLGIIFGHMARAQIRRTGEQGWGLATVGLVLGYVGVVGLIVVGILYVVLFGLAFR